MTSPPLWPQANGEEEVQNKSILKALKVAHAEGKRWQDELHKFLLAHRSTPRTSTGATPAYLMFSRELKTKIPELRREKSQLDDAIRDLDCEMTLSSRSLQKCFSIAADRRVLEIFYYIFYRVVKGVIL